MLEFLASPLVLICLGVSLAITLILIAFGIIIYAISNEEAARRDRECGLTQIRDDHRSQL